MGAWAPPVAPKTANQIICIIDYVNYVILKNIFLSSTDKNVFKVNNRRRWIKLRLMLFNIYRNITLEEIVENIVKNTLENYNCTIILIIQLQIIHVRN